MTETRHISRVRFETEVLKRTMDEDEFKVFIKERELGKSVDELKRAVYTATARKTAIEIATIVERFKENDINLIAMVDAELSAWPVSQRKLLVGFLIGMNLSNKG